MADGELKDMEHFFSTLPNPFSDSEVYKTSVVGKCQLTAEWLLAQPVITLTLCIMI